MYTYTCIYIYIYVYIYRHIRRMSGSIVLRHTTPKSRLRTNLHTSRTRAIYISTGKSAECLALVRLVCRFVRSLDFGTYIPTYIQVNPPNVHISRTRVPHICWTSGTTHVSRSSFWGTPHWSHNIARMYTTTLHLSCAIVSHICWTSGTTHGSSCSFWDTPHWSHDTARVYTMTLHMIYTTVPHISWTSGTTHMSSKSAGLFWRSLLSCTGLFCRYWRYIQWMFDSSSILQVSFQIYKSLLQVSFHIYGSPFSVLEVHPDSVWQQLFLTNSLQRYSSLLQVSL